MITVEPWPISQFDSARKSGTLIISPEYQRRPVWNAKDKMLLVDSLARGVPVGAITLYEDDSKGFAIHEVIDGKQRLSAIVDFLENRLVVRTNVIESSAIDDDEFGLETDPTTTAFHQKKFDELDVPSRMKFLQYKLPVFVVTGSRADAIRAFTRMNRSNYSLKPQEIRNAFFAGSGFLETAADLVQELDTTGGTTPPGSYFVTMGVMSRQAYDRMQDLQFASELLILALAGPQHRRDSVDQHYELYRNAAGAAAAALDDARTRVATVCVQLMRIFDETALQAYHFPTTCENDFYGLAGALLARGTLTQPQMNKLAPELREVLAGFRAQVEEYIARVRSDAPPTMGEFDEIVEEYGRGFLGGQINSKQRREDRIRIWAKVIDGVAASLDPNSTFTSIQRRLIWARNLEHTCARCGEEVQYADYHAGHKVPRAMGGPTTIENGQVEHSWCNEAAGAN